MFSPEEWTKRPWPMVVIEGEATEALDPLDDLTLELERVVVSVVDECWIIEGVTVLVRVEYETVSS